MINIGLGEYIVSSNINEVLVTHALGTCVAIVIHCNVTHLTAMAHVVLPKRGLNHQKHLTRTAYFADDIVDYLMSTFLHERNCHKDSLKITLIGGAEAKNSSDVFRVGEKNVYMIKKLLEPYKIPYDDLETLGRMSRTVSIDVLTGHVQVKKQKMLL